MFIIFVIEITFAIEITFVLEHTIFSNLALIASFFGLLLHT